MRRPSTRSDRIYELGRGPEDRAEPRRRILLDLGDADRLDPLHGATRRPVGEDLPPAELGRRPTRLPPALKSG